MGEKYAVLLDGGFVRKRLESRNRAVLLAQDVVAQEQKDVFATASDVVGLVTRYASHPRLEHRQLYRAYFYDAPPLSGTKKNPLSGKPYNFGAHPTHALNQRLQASLAQASDFAVRRGELVFRGWKVRGESIEHLQEQMRQLVESDLAPDVEQKGVDLRIGLDIAALAFKRIVDIVVLVTADSDLVPAMKLARREGLRVYLDIMGSSARGVLTEHADYVFSS